jgi:Acetyltransferase (GNAT) family
MTHIRLAVEADLPAIVELAQLAVMESRFAWIPYRAKRVWSTTQDRIASSNCLSLVAFDAQGELVGFLQAQHSSYDFATAGVAHLRYWYVIPALRGSLVAMKMFTGFQLWAKQQEVLEITASATYDCAALDNATAKLYQKLGLKPTTPHYSRWIDA